MKSPYFRSQNGFSMLETVVAMVIMMILVGAFIVGMSNVLRVSDFEDNILNLDKQGYRMMQELSEQLRPAILPIFLSDTERRTSGDNIFALLEDPVNGFGGSEGRAWRNALKTGVNSLAFVVSVDAQDDGDSLDDDNRLEVGQIRPDGDRLIHYLDSDFVAGATSFQLSTTAPASSLKFVDLGKFFNDNTGGKEVVDLPGDIMEDTSPALNHYAFYIVRFVPQRVSGSSDLVVIREQDLLIDLDGDDNSSGTFNSYNIGKLQLVYVGGPQYVQPARTDTTSTNPPVGANVETLTVDLCGNVVLRNIDGSDPIFRLVRYNPNSIGGNGITNLDGQSGVMALHIQMTLFDPAAFARMRPHLKTLSDGGPDQRHGFSRKYEAVVTLRNMAR